MGAQFEAADYAVSGSGSPAVRSILYYENTWGKRPLKETGREEAVILALRTLDTAADTDTATGGVDRRGRVYPIVKIVTGDGITTLSEEDLAKIFKKEVK
jgi:proteasome beta subunit